MFVFSSNSSITKIIHIIFRRAASYQIFHIQKIMHILFIRTTSCGRGGGALGEGGGGGAGRPGLACCPGDGGGRGGDGAAREGLGGGICKRTN